MTQEQKDQMIQEIKELARKSIDWVGQEVHYANYEAALISIIDKYTNTCTKEKS